MYRPGEAIPSLRALALELVVNPNTVQRAFEELEREGLIRARKGRGMFVCQDGTQTARNTSEAAVHRALVDAVRAARAAGMPDVQIRGIFEKAIADAETQVSNEP